MVKKRKMCEKPERKRIGCGSQMVVHAGPRPPLVARLNSMKEGVGKEREVKSERERERLRDRERDRER